MFGLTPATLEDPALGLLKRDRWRSLWRGTVTLDGQQVPLILAGNRRAPSPAALRAAHTMQSQYTSWQPCIAQALYTHCAPYVEAIAAGELPAPASTLPPLAQPDQVWPHVSLVFASVLPLGVALTVELAYATAWDEEHLVAARFLEGRFLELCGSVIAP
ncbi:hypothetical protein [Leeia sp.]|uniref:DUF6985 domain-containing protein n=1 Tax=Leeia sp. TaxID=2884678 RepID=UPI0035AFC8FE